MSLWDRVSGDDLAALGLVWLLLVVLALGLYVYGARRWEQRKHLPPPAKDCARFNPQARGVFR